MPTDVLQDPLFWACVSLLALTAGNAIVANALPRSSVLGLAVIAGVMLSRFILVLPFCPQPRFELAGLHWPLGLALMVASGALLVPVFRVQWTTGPDASERLQTAGAYGLVRHPGYLGNILLGLGLAVSFRSTLGVLLTAFWYVGFLLHAMIEEASLERSFGEAYLAYKARVPGRILPWPRALSRTSG